MRHNYSVYVENPWELGQVLEAEGLVSVHELHDYYYPTDVNVTPTIGFRFGQAGVSYDSLEEWREAEFNAF